MSKATDGSGTKGDEWVLYYWDSCGRGEFVRLVFEELGVPFKEVNGLQDILGVINGEVAGVPVFAPPVIKKGEFVLSQTGAIVEYIAKYYDGTLLPETEHDIFRARQLQSTILDFITQGRLVFHGKKWRESYFIQKEETQPYIDWFLDGRFQTWLGHLEKALAANNGGKAYLVGNKLTYVDLSLLHILRASSSQFPEVWDKMEDIPLLKAFKERMEARPNLAAYFKSDRCKPFEGNSMM